jgi:predicted PhzF superfamily epimerase YddE/YHI9
VAAFARAGMAGVAMGVVVDADRLAVAGGQPLAQQFDGFGAHAGSTFLNGLTVTFS